MPSKTNLLLQRVWKNSKLFFEKPIYFLNKKPKILNALRNLFILDAFYGKFATSSDFEKIQDFFQKTHVFSHKNPNFERFEIFYYFSRILRQICYL